MRVSVFVCVCVCVYVCVCVSVCVCADFPLLLGDLVVLTFCLFLLSRATP